jgi:disulfide bond formation protein DsbB
MNAETLHYINMLLGLGAIVLQVLSLLAIIFLLFGSKNNSENKYLSFIKNHFLEIGFFITLSAVLVSLFYSEILNYVPCFHCWVARIFIFSQAVIFAVALSRRDGNVFFYSLPLTLLGLADALFLNYKYYFNPNSAPCDASGVSCVQQLVSEWGGYISIPMLALTGFVALLTLLLVVHFHQRENQKS